MNAFILSDDEMRYCTALGEWWKTVCPENLKPQPESPAGNVVRIGDYMETPSSSSAKPWARLHRLIQDASPNIQPNGYFDCTIEVSHFAA